MKLRDYQIEGVAKTYDLLREGKRRIIYAACTGSGKTVVIAKITSDAIAAGRKVLIVVDDSPLIPQTINTLNKFGVEVGVIKAGYTEDRSKPCQLASIDTLIRREYPEAHIIIVDECHLSYSTKYDKLFENYDGRVFLGFSATPERTSKKESLLKIWEALVRSLTIEEAVSINANVPPLVYSIKRDSLNLKAVKTSRGDYDSKQLSLAMRNPNIVSLAVDTWIEKGEGRPTICFAVDIDHSKQLQADFISKGIKADHIDGSHSENERQQKYLDLRTGKTQVLCSVNVLSIGFDEPSVSCILCCRPTKSLIMWIQQVGRGLRLYEGKEDCIVLDQAENTFNLMHPLEYSPPDLDAPRKKQGECPSKECPDCGLVVPNFVMKCPACGYEFPPPKKLTSHAELDVVAPILKNPILMEQKLYYQQLAQKAFYNGYSPGWALVKFKEKYNCFPSKIIKYQAVFGGQHTEEDVDSYINYLLDVQSRKQKTPEWIYQQLTAEFGKIGQDKREKLA